MQLHTIYLSSDVDPHWSYADPDPQNLVNADPDPGWIQDKNHKIYFKQSIKRQEEKNIYKSVP